VCVCDTYVCVCVCVISWHSILKILLWIQAFLLQCVMVNFICQFDWTEGCSGSW
jgi:hypothetical protein